MHGFQAKSKAHSKKRKINQVKFPSFFYKRRFNLGYVFTLQQALLFWAFLYIAYQFGSIINIFAIAFTDVNYLNYGIKNINLPIAKNAEKTTWKRHQIYITINKDNVIIIDKTLFYSDSISKNLNTNNRDYIEIIDPKLPLPELLAWYFKMRFSENTSLIACIYADKKCTMEPIHMILGALKKANLSRIVYMTDKPKSAVEI